MAARSGISWTDHSFAPWHGCTKVSVGAKGACALCYAENLDDLRFHRVRFGNFPRLRSPQSTWDEPRAWNRKAAKDGVRRFVFCSHLSDVFDNQVDPTWRADLFLLIHETPNLIWLLLTKRPQNIVKLGPDPAAWPRNAAIGCTVVTQAEADRDVPVLLAAKAALGPAFAFLSCEPLMEAVDLSEWLFGRAGGPCAECPLDADCWCGWQGRHTLDGEAGIGWVIAGGETDQGKQRARPSNPDWFRQLRDQCAAAGVPFHFKQWGSWLPGQNEVFPGFPDPRGHERWVARFQDRTDPAPTAGFGHRDVSSAALKGGKYLLFGQRPYGPGVGYFTMHIGAKRAGRHLDGVLHDARPEVARG